MDKHSLFREKEFYFLVKNGISKYDRCLLEYGVRVWSREK